MNWLRSQKDIRICFIIILNPLYWIFDFDTKKPFIILHINIAFISIEIRNYPNEFGDKETKQLEEYLEGFDENQ